MDHGLTSRCEGVNPPPPQGRDFDPPNWRHTGMTTSPLPRHLKVLRVGSYASAAPPRLLEYAYYALFYYSTVTLFLGISIPNLAGMMQLALAACCVICLGSRATVVYTSIRLPLACALSFVIVQITFYDESIKGGEVRAFIDWILVLIIFQSLYLRRGFLHRCVLVFFSMGLLALPHLKAAVGTAGLHERVAVDAKAGVGFTNANGLGEWFGFFCLYFTIVGLESKRTGVRVASSLAAVGCLLVVGLSVSRGALLGTALGITIALRRVLRRGFVPLLVFIILNGTLYTFGVFDRMIAHYTARGMEETGRSLIWPVAIEHFLSSPLIGVGAANVGVYVPSTGRYWMPHNGFIQIALVSGILPLALFVASWIRAAQNAFSSDAQLADGPFRLPLLVYAFVSTMVGGGVFVAWGILSFVVALASSTPYGGCRLIVRRVKKASAGSTLWTPR